MTTTIDSIIKIVQFNVTYWKSQLISSNTAWTAFADYYKLVYE